jgi:hypothetical protein
MSPPFFYFIFVCVCFIIFEKEKLLPSDKRASNSQESLKETRATLLNWKLPQQQQQQQQSSRPSWDEIPSVTLGFSTCLCPSFLSSSSSIRPKERELQQSIERLIIQPLYSFLFLIPYYYYYDEIQAARNNGGNICFRMAASRPIYTDFHFLIVI